MFLLMYRTSYCTEYISSNPPPLPRAASSLSYTQHSLFSYPRLLLKKYSFEKESRGLNKEKVFL